MLGTASFYEMFKLEPVGRYVVNICTNISLPAEGRRRAARTTPRTALGVEPGGTTDDGLFTLEDVECIAACTEAPACR